MPTSAMIRWTELILVERTARVQAGRPIPGPSMRWLKRPVRKRCGKPGSPAAKSKPSGGQVRSPDATGSHNRPSVKGQ